MRWCTVVLAVLGCGGSEPKQPDAPIDAPGPDAGCAADACNPLSNMGCTATQKCTWLTDATPPRLGRTACSFAGAVPIGLPCTRDAGGGDGCVVNATCYMGTCARICDLAGGTACGAGLTCRATTLFVPCGSTAPVAGVCAP